MEWGLPWSPAVLTARLPITPPRSSPPSTPPIPPFSHTEYYLEDALEQTRFRVTRPSSHGGSRDGPGGKKEVKDKAAPIPRGLEEYSEQTRAGLAAIDEATINYELIGSVVEHVIATKFSKGPAQAILIFASGAEEIDKVVRQLRSSRQPLHVLPLHGGLPPAQQSAVFQRPPKGATAQSAVKHRAVLGRGRPARARRGRHSTFLAPLCPSWPLVHASPADLLPPPCRLHQGGGGHQCG